MKINLQKQPKKFLSKIEKQDSLRILEKIYKILTRNNFPRSSRSIINQKRVFRLRIGKYRILYVINYEKNTIEIIKIDKRSRIYD